LDTKRLQIDNHDLRRNYWLIKRRPERPGGEALWLGGGQVTRPALWCNWLWPKHRWCLTAHEGLIIMMTGRRMGGIFIYEFEMHYHFQLIALTQALRNVHFPENYAN